MYGSITLFYQDNIGAATAEDGGGKKSFKPQHMKKKRPVFTSQNSCSQRAVGYAQPGPSGLCHGSAAGAAWGSSWGFLVTLKTWKFGTSPQIHRHLK